MEKYFLAICFLGFSYLHAQVIFSEDFQDQNMPTGALFYDFDSSDNLITLDPSIDPSTWYIWSDRRVAPDDYFAWSTAFAQDFSYKAMDNWMVIPNLIIPPMTTLFFDTRKVGINNQNEEYIEVWVSTTGTDPADFTTKISTILTTRGWDAHEVDLSPFANQTVHLAFVGKSTAGSHIGLDNIQIISSSVMNNNVANLDISLENSYLLPDDYDLFLSIKNEGTTTIQSIDVNYTIDGGSTVFRQTINGLNLPLLGEDNLQLTDFIDLNRVGAYQLAVWLSNPNNFEDTNPADDTLRIDVVVLEEGAPKKVLLEEFTGTWCVWCPRGPIVIEQLKPIYGDDLIVVAHHNRDPMEFAETETLLDEMNDLTNGYPSGAIDRYRINPDASIIAVGDDAWDNYIAERLTHLSSAELTAEINYDENSRLLNVEAKANFLADDIGDLRLNCFLIENDVTGYPQANIYNADSLTYPELFMAGDPIVDYVHQEVLRAMLGGVFGVETAIPESISAGNNYTHPFSYTVPIDYDISKMKVILVLTKHDARDPINRHFVVNAAEYDISDRISSTTNLNASTSNISIYPNPVDDYITINFEKELPTTLSLLDIVGRVIWAQTGSINNSLQIDMQDLSSGTYFLQFEGNGFKEMKKIVVQ